MPYLLVCRCHQVVTRFDGCLWILGRLLPKILPCFAQRVYHATSSTEGETKRADEFGWHDLSRAICVDAKVGEVLILLMP